MNSHEVSNNYLLMMITMRNRQHLRAVGGEARMVIAATRIWVGIAARDTDTARTARETIQRIGSRKTRRSRTISTVPDIKSLAFTGTRDALVVDLNPAWLVPLRCVTSKILTYPRRAASCKAESTLGSWARAFSTRNTLLASSGIYHNCTAQE